MSEGRINESCASGRQQSVDGHPVTQWVQAASFTYQRRRWRVIDSAVRDDIGYLTAAADGEMSITSRSRNDRVWTVGYDAPEARGNQGASGACIGQSRKAVLPAGHFPPSLARCQRATLS